MVKHKGFSNQKHFCGPSVDQVGKCKVFYPLWTTLYVTLLTRHALQGVYWCEYLLPISITRNNWKFQGKICFQEDPLASGSSPSSGGLIRSMIVIIKFSGVSLHYTNGFPFQFKLPSLPTEMKKYKLLFGHVSSLQWTHIHFYYFFKSQYASIIEVESY